LSSLLSEFTLVERKLDTPTSVLCSIPIAAKISSADLAWRGAHHSHSHPAETHSHSGRAQAGAKLWTNNQLEILSTNKLNGNNVAFITDPPPYFTTAVIIWLVVLIVVLVCFCAICGVVAWSVIKKRRQGPQGQQVYPMAAAQGQGYGGGAYGVAPDQPQATPFKGGGVTY